MDQDLHRLADDGCPHHDETDALDPYIEEAVRRTVEDITDTINRHGAEIERQYREGALSGGCGFDWFPDS